MTTWEYIIDGILAGTSAKMLIEQLSQLKADRARGLAKRTGLPIEQMTAIAEIDPTANGSYMDWLAKIVFGNTKHRFGCGVDCCDAIVLINRYQCLIQLFNYRFVLGIQQRDLIGFKTIEFTDETSR